jgi:hypothetical protein
MASFQAIVHARQEAKQELSTLRETVRIRAEQRAQEKKRAGQETANDERRQGKANQRA